MKLTQKLLAACALTLVIVMGLCSALLIGSSRAQLIASAKQDAAYEYSDTIGRFHAQTLRYLRDEHFSTVQHQLLNYNFKQAARGKAALFAGDFCLFNSCGFNPEEHLIAEPGSEPALKIIYINGEHLILCGGQAVFSQSGSTYRVYTAKNISTLYEDIEQLSGTFVLISLIGCLLGVVTIMIFLQISLNPLKRLNDASFRIAQGEYSERIIPHGNDELAALAGSFNQMADSVEYKIHTLTEAAERQRMFASAVSHEFKTPLTAISLTADSLQNLYMSEEEQYEALNVIQRQCCWLETLLQKLLSLTKLRTLSDIRPCGVAELFDAVNESCRELLAQNNVLLQMSCSVNELPMDPDLMQSALVNLIKNAVKASSPGQIVRLTAYDRTIEVSDTGCGMSEEELAHAFEPFFMGDQSRTKSQGNLGLGLALVKETAACHQAQVCITSEKGKGTTVKIIFR